MQIRLSHCFLAMVLGVSSLVATADDRRLVLTFTTAITLEVAITDAERARGLQNRALVPHGTGMVFAHEELVASKNCFWMQDTFASLDAAFVDADGQILHIATMQPRSEEAHCPPAPAVWVIEAPAHWFRRQGLAIGMYVGDDNLIKLRSLD